LKSQIPSTKFQIYPPEAGKSQILNTNDQDYFDFSTITEPEAFTAYLPPSIFGIVLDNILMKNLTVLVPTRRENVFLKILYWFAIWDLGHWYLFVI
jgi:hypothetical protein